MHRDQRNEIYRKIILKKFGGVKKISYLCTTKQIKERIMWIGIVIIVLIALAVDNGIRENGSLKAWVEQLKEVDE